jgi:type I restriction enzyme S subunit
MVPKIRIKGFTEDWEKTAFADLYERSIVKNDLSFGTDKIISVANMYFSSSVSQSDEEYLRSYNVMRLGDIAFEGNKSKNYAHGRFVENTIGDGFVSHVFVVLSPKSDCLRSEFLEILY